MNKTWPIGANNEPPVAPCQIDFKSKTVLIIDDHPGMRSSLRTTMSGCGAIAIDMAQNVADALRRVQSRTYDIIICDYDLEDTRSGQHLLEELRHKRLISMSTAFLMVTAERGYEKVVAAAELAPDDYLIKPFTASTLMARIERTLAKKRLFSKVHALMDRCRVAEAVSACDEIIAQAKGKYVVDALRLKAEFCLALGKHTEAHSIYEKVMAFQAIPWARMGLARSMVLRAGHAEAEPILADLVAEHPGYLGAYDLLAQVQIALDKPAEAQSVLARAVERSPSIPRQRALGESARMSGDIEVAEKAFQAVVGSSKKSALTNAEDFANLVRLQLDMGKVDAAARTVADLNAGLEPNATTEIVSALMSSLVLQKQGDSAEAREKLDHAIALQERTQSDLSDTLAMDVVKSCRINGRPDHAAKVLKQVIRDNHDSQSFLAHARAVMNEFDMATEVDKIAKESAKEAVHLNNQGVALAKQGDLPGAVAILSQAADQMPGNAQIVLNAAHSILVLIEKSGWDQDLMQKAKSYLDRARKKDALHPKFGSVLAMYQAVTKKYGTSSSD